jgi:D-serine deaminase-like pyridoxal phosphate-dependent protein
MPTHPWYVVTNADEIASPALLLYAERIDANLHELLAMVGDPRRLRPHMKTHKLAPLIDHSRAHGIAKFK